ncbi:MAG: hypothetical protein M5U16_01900 [Hyphomicrobium sp.]|nr:hypothetical protein [Hyphomicrobium sp.]
MRAARERALAMGAHATSVKKRITLRLDMLRTYFAYGNFALAGLWATLAPHAVPARAPSIPRK